MIETPRPAKHEDAHLPNGEVQKEGNVYTSSLFNGASTVQLPSTLGDMMYRMLRIQDKIGDRLEVNARTRSIVSMLNCRKTAAIAGGTLSLRDAVATGRDKLQTAEEILTALEDPYLVDEDGLLDMLRDCDALLHSGAIPAIWTPLSERITAQIRDNTFPKVVHVFGPKGSEIQSLLTKIATRSLAVEDLVHMGFIHSFIITGKGDDGTYHCFHKQGPSIHEHVEVTSLEDLFTHVFATSMNRQYLSIVGNLQQ